MVHFELTNQMMDVTRIYPSVVNLFQKVGGVAQILIFIFVYIVLYNNDIILEQYLLNTGILELKDSSHTLSGD